VLLDDGNYIVVDELPRRPPDELLLVAQLGIEFQKVHARKCRHNCLAAAPSLHEPENA